MFDSTVWEILLGSIPTPVLLYSGWASKSNYISILPKIIGDQQMILCVLFHLKIGIKIFNLFCTFNMCHCVTIFTRSDCTILHFQILLNRENNVFLKIFDILVEFLPYLKKKVEKIRWMQRWCFRRALYLKTARLLSKHLGDHP